MRQSKNDDYLVWYCDWCDSKNLIPIFQQHESNRCCPACARHAALLVHNPEFDALVLA